MALKALLVADPVANIAELIKSRCRRLADNMLAATDGEHALALVEQWRPELVVLSLELTRPAVDQVVPKIIKRVPDVLMIATFRELTVPTMEKFSALGIHEFVAHPISATEIFRAVARRFHLPFRQHERFDVQVEVRRADGASLGQTTNVSEGGMRVRLLQTLQPNESVLVELPLPDGNPKPLRSRWRVLDVESHAGPGLFARGPFDNLRGEELRRMVAFLSRLEPQAGTAH